MLKLYIYMKAPFDDISSHLSQLISNCYCFAAGESESVFKVVITSFPEFNESHVITFVFYAFHSYFDGSIGLNDLREMNLNNYLTNNVLSNKNLPIPSRTRKLPSIRLVFTYNLCYNI